MPKERSKRFQFSQYDVKRVAIYMGVILSTFIVGNEVLIKNVFELHTSLAPEWIAMICSFLGIIAVKFLTNYNTQKNANLD